MAAPWEIDDLKTQLECIRRGGKWTSGGQEQGNGLFWHFRKAQTLCWPDDDHHRWSDLILEGIINNDVTVLMGASDTGKTFTASKWAMIDYWAFPTNTLTIISSTEMRGLELRIWGAIKELFNRARELFPWLAGNALEAHKCITTEDIDDSNKRARSIRKGIVCVPCMSGGKYVGLGRYMGIKAQRLRHIGDEVSVMKRSFLDAYANWYGKPDFRGVLCGNPLEVTDPLGIAAEPQEGWTAMPIPEKTKTWRSRFYNAFVINLVGTDSPNFDYPKELGVKYPYLISWKKLEAVKPDTLLFASQVEGVMRPSLHGKRVFTREFAREHHAMDDAVWDTPAQTTLFSLDPAYGGGDRCACMWGQFGDDPQGRHILELTEPEEIPINVRSQVPVEDQIALYVQMRLREKNIPPKNAFYDSFGKGTIGFAFARLFGTESPQPVNSGDKPTTRPVRFDLYVQEKDGRKRLKRCDEHYSKFVTELWFSLREATEGDQIRGLTESVLDELCKRSYSIVAGNKLEVEPKDDMIQRTGASPDFADCAAILMEGARRLGFRIERLGTVSENVDADDAEAERLEEEMANDIQGNLLRHDF